jgi:hypothetical protein
MPSVDDTGAAKLLLVSRTLRLRRDRPDLFTRYTPLESSARHPRTPSRSTGAVRSPSRRVCPSGSPRAAAGATPR